MASTEVAASIVPLSEVDVPQAVELSASAHWNQNADDWRMMLSLGEGYGIRAVDERGVQRLAASVMLLPYGGRFAWVSMVLVWPTFQRRGLASTLLRHALSLLESRGMAAVLDATPAGYDVYVHQGFKPTWGFARYRREGVTGARVTGSALPTGSLRQAHWSDIESFDALAFGASRLALLHALAGRWSVAARVVEQRGRVRGVMWGREGREAHQIGPLLADDLPAAQALISHALSAAPGPVYLDLLDERRVELLPWLEQQGFVFQRPFTRMVWGIDRAPGDTRHIWAAAGPELG